MKNANKILSAVFGFTLLSGAIMVADVATPVAHAQTQSAKTIVDSAKSKGLVGESISGYLALVNTNAPASVKAAVNEINIRRKSVYTQLARAKNESVSDVAGVSGEKLISKAKTGEKVKLSSGVWQTR